MKEKIVLSLMAAGALLAQQTPARQHFGRGPAGRPPDFETQLTQKLGLNAEQQQKVHTILAETRLSQQAPMQQMQSLRTSLTTAIKAGDESQIDKITEQIGALHQQQTAIHAKSVAKIYGTLTADQKTKAGANLELLMRGPMFGPTGPPKAGRRGPAAQTPQQPQQQN
jgi:Spy/CpxP family protein refolding chaperone